MRKIGTPASRRLSTRRPAARSETLPAQPAETPALREEPPEPTALTDALDKAARRAKRRV